MRVFPTFGVRKRAIPNVEEVVFVDGEFEHQLRRVSEDPWALSATCEESHHLKIAFAEISLLPWEDAQETQTRDTFLWKGYAGLRNRYVVRRTSS